MTSDTADTVQNRSEIVFAFDAVDANPNGNPLSGSNRPRIDEQTRQAIVTDVRIKRYLRDQLDDDGHGVFIKNADDRTDDALTRQQLFEDIIGVDSPEDLPDDPFAAFTGEATDVRMFGATFSIDADDDSAAQAALAEMPSHLTGAMQVQPAKSIHPVQTNEQYNSLTSVIATKEGKEQGGFDLDDHRIKYAFIRSSAVVNENAAETTNLTEADVRRLDTLYWRALKNQANSRSKSGQNPRLYLRVEYDTDHYHIGGLDALLSVDEDRSEPAAEMRDIGDICVDVTDLVGRLVDAGDHVASVRVVADPSLRASVDGEEVDAEGFYAALENALGSDAVDVIDVYDEYEETLA